MIEILAKRALKKIKRDYENIAEEFDATRQVKWPEFDYYLKFIKDGNNLADLGCGNGRFYDYLRNLRNVNYSGVDSSRRLIVKARQKFQQAKFLIGDLLNLPVPDNSQDVAVAIASLHHLPSKDLRLQAVNEMWRILKPGGILMISVWNLYQPKYKKFVRRGILRNFFTLGLYDKKDLFIPWGKSGVKRYYYAFRSEELSELLKQKFSIKEEFHNNNLIYICKKY